jgi:carbonic anhydrase/acetyltransferase-like protein (isoleucine patch superfamily)
MIYALDSIAPQIDPTAWIADTAVIIGKVSLGASANIWFGAVARGDNEWIDIGAGSNVQENCVLHTDIGFPLTIGENCTIGHKALLHGCTIGAGTLIGMNATVMNGAKIGRFCIIGAGALVTEGKEIPDYSLVMGAPAKIIRTLDTSAENRLLTSAAHYRSAAQRMATGLQKLEL